MIKNGSVVKYQARPEVYLIQNGERHWIPDPATLLSRWSWSQVQTFDQKSVDSFPMGDPIPSVHSGQKWPDGALMEADAGSPVYVVTGGQRHWIPDPPTFNANPNYAWDAIEVVPSDVLNAIPLGAPIPSVIPAAPGEFIVYTGDTNLGANHWMNTKADLNLASGLIRAITRTWTGTWFGGFHGGVYIIVVNGLGFPVRFADGAGEAIVRFGVDGTADPFGVSNRTDGWTVQLDPGDAHNAVSMTIFHAWDPDSFQTALNKWLAAVKPVADLYVSVFGSSKATTGSKA